jgi:hypothetical protein
MRGMQLKPNVWSELLACALVMVILIVSAGASVWAFRGLYADGADKILIILSTANFFHPEETRISATFVQEYPVVIAVKLGVSDIRLLVRLYTATLFVVPIFAYIISTWFSRKDPLLFTISVAFICAVFYTTSFDISSEYHLLYSLYWCVFILLITGRCDELPFACALPLVGFALVRSYEISVILCAILSFSCFWRIWMSKDPASRAILLVSAYLFAAGVWFALQGAMFPPDPANAKDFAASLRDIASYAVIIGIIALFALAAAAGLAVHSYRVASVAILIVASAGFAWWRFGAGNEFALGPAHAERAKVVPIILGLSLLATRYGCGQKVMFN